MKILLSLLFVLLSCTHKKPEVAPAPVLVTQASDVLSNDVILRWKAIWKASEPIIELKKFQKVYGLFLETTHKEPTFSYHSGEGPCGDSYTSLVKSSKKLPEAIHEINVKAKTLKKWNSGSGRVYSIHKNKLFREVEFYEDPNDYSIKVEEKGKSHSFLLGIDDKGSFEVLKKDNSSIKTEFEEVTCPPIMATNSDFSYCVKDPATKRLFVFQRPCT